MSHYGDAGPRNAGTVLTVDFVLDGQPFTAINGGPQFTFDEAISFLVNCADQDEVDYYWEKLSEGGEESQCGWLKDRFGLSWQIVPTEHGRDPRRPRPGAQPPGDAGDARDEEARPRRAARRGRRRLGHDPRLAALGAQRQPDRARERPGDHHEREPRRRVEHVGEQHLQPDEAEDHAEPDVEVPEPPRHAREQEVEGRSPRIANAFDANTMNGSRLTARIAGTESTANTTSVVSTSTSTTNSGVASQRAGTAGEELLPVVLGGRRHDAADEPQHRVALGMHLGLAGAGRSAPR